MSIGVVAKSALGEELGREGREGRGGGGELKRRGGENRGARSAP